MMESNTSQELLSAQEQVEKTKELIKTNESAPGMEDVVAFAKTKLLGLEEKVNSILKNRESKVSQVEEQGGSRGEVVERTQGVDEKIEEVKTEMAEQIKEVESEGAEGNRGIKNETKEENQDEGVKEEVQDKLEVEDQKVEKIEKNQDEIEIDNINTAIDSEIERVNKALSEVENAPLPEDLNKYLEENKNRIQEINSKISELKEKIDDYKENSPESRAEKLAIDIHLEKMKEVDNLLLQEINKMDSFDNKKMLDIGKKVYSFELEKAKKEYKDDPDALNERIKELKQGLSEMTPDGLRNEFKKDFELVIRRWDGGSSKYQLENENERLNNHKDQIKLATIITDNEKLIGKSSFEKELEKKVNELDSANHDLLEKNISYKNNFPNDLENQVEELRKKSYIVYNNSSSHIDDYIRLKEREINDSADSLSIDKLRRDNSVLGNFLHKNEYAPREEDYKEKEEKLGLSRLYESSRQKSIKLTSIRENIKKDYI